MQTLVLQVHSRPGLRGDVQSWESLPLKVGRTTDLLVTEVIDDIS